MSRNSHGIGAAPRGAVTVRGDRAGRVRYSTTSSSVAELRRFMAFQQAILREASLGGEARLLGLLIGTEAVLTRRDLTLATAALPEGLFADRSGRLFLEWTWGEGWLDRRMLGPVVCAVLEQPGVQVVSENAAIAELAGFVRATVPFWDEESDEIVVERVLTAGRAWAVLSLPGFLAAHVCRDSPLCALPRSAWARRESGLALSITGALAAPPANISTMGRLLDAIHVADTVGGDARALLDVLKKSLREGARIGGTHYRVRQEMLRLIGVHIEAACRSGWQAALLFAWTVDLIESGTERVPELAVNTILGYVPPLLEPIMLELQGITALTRDAAAWFEIYQRVLASKSAGSRKNLASAMASFHDHLVRWHGINALDQALHTQLPDPPPAANTVWPHEMDRIHQWLARCDLDDRLRGAISVSLRLAWSCRLRTEELMTLRLRNVQGAVLEVAPMIRDRQPKSDSSVRAMHLDDVAVSALDDWVCRRRTEGATDIDLLFGDPHHPDHVYRRGTLHAALIGLLRAATGDPSVVFHTLSHAWCDRQIVGGNRERGDVNWLNPIAAGMGHFSASSLRSYAHQYERLLQGELHAVLSSMVTLNATDCARLIGEPPASVRKRLERLRAREGQGDRNAQIWSLLYTYKAKSTWPDVAEGIALVESVPPSWLKDDPPPSAERVAWILEDLATQRPPEDLVAWVCRRNACMPKLVHSVVHAAMQILRLVGAWSPSRRIWRSGDHDAHFLREFLLWNASARMDFKRRHAEKYLPLLSVLPASVEAPAWIIWAEGYWRSGYFALDPTRAATLFDWLRRCGVSGLSVGISVCSDATEGLARERAAIRGAFRAAFGVPCPTFEHVPHQARPKIYFLWSAQPIEEDVRPPSAAISLDGFHAWMLAAGVAAVLREQVADVSGLLMPSLLRKGK